MSPVTIPTEQEERTIGRPLMRAIREAADGPGISVRVEEILEWVAIDPAILARMIGQLGGPTSAGRHLGGIAPSTIRRWRMLSRIPSKALAKLTELIAAGVPPKKRPRERHD